MKSNIQVIKDKEIKFLKFPKEDVLINKSERIDRFVKLHRVLYLTRTNCNKVKIVFHDGIGLKSVDTQISDVTDKYVKIKKTMVIPLERIVGVIMSCSSRIVIPENIF